MDKKELVEIQEIETNITTKFFTDYWIELCNGVKKFYNLKAPLVRIDGYAIEFQDNICVILIIHDKKNPVKFSYNFVTEHFHLYREILK